MVLAEPWPTQRMRDGIHEARIINGNNRLWLAGLFYFLFPGQGDGMVS